MPPPRRFPDASRFTLALTAEQRAALGRAAHRERLTVAELLRRIIDRWVEAEGRAQA